MTTTTPRHRKNATQYEEPKMSITERAGALLPRSRAAVRDAGTYIVYAAAVLASLGTLYELALHYAGWNAGTALLFAVTIDIYWLTAFHAAMDKSLSRGKRAGAALHGLAAVAVSAFCNVLYHELHAGIWHLGHSAGALVTAGMASVPLLVAAALTHLRFITRAEKAAQATVNRPRTRTAPQRPRTVPLDRPIEPPQTETLDETEPPQDEDAATLPRALKAGGRPDPIAVAKAAEIYKASLRAGELLNRRTLAAAVNEHYGFPVIGETSASAVIDEHRSKRSA
jgi:hypothetical protein